MLTYRKNVTHFPQLKGFNCGPVALSCLFDAPVDDLEKLVLCDKNKGTYTSDVSYALRQARIAHSHVCLKGDAVEHLWWIEQNSYRWPIYAGCHFVTQGKRGRPSNRHHAVLFANGFVYDGGCHREEPIGAIAANFNKKFIINDIIIFEHELSGWKKSVELAA